MSFFLNPFKRKPETSLRITEGIKKIDFIGAPSVDGIRGVAVKKVNLHGLVAANEEKTDIRLIPDEQYTVYLANGHEVLGQYIYKGLIKTQDGENTKSLFFTCIKNCSMTGDGEEFEIGYNELSKYKFSKAIRGGKRPRKTFRKRRYRKSRRTRKTKIRNRK